jgi:hypothetical protein
MKIEFQVANTEYKILNIEFWVFEFRVPGIAQCAKFQVFHKINKSSSAEFRVMNMEFQVFCKMNKSPKYQVPDNKY